MHNYQVYRSLDDLGCGQWDGSSPSLPRRQAVLSTLQRSGINDLEHFYLTIGADPSTSFARANLYINTTDFSTFDQELAGPALRAIKSLNESFMTFRMLECGFFTMIGMGIEADDDSRFAEALDTTIKAMDDLAVEQTCDFMLIRDMPLACYQANRERLLKAGYVPALGFSNTVIENSWRTFDEYLMELNSKTRNKFRAALKLKEKFDVDVEFVSEYTELAPILAKLWRNVNEKSADYSREILDENFFREYAAMNGDGAGSEVLLFRHHGEIIAFMFNIYDENEYVMLDWGVDYDFEHYDKANLYRAASALCLGSAIDKGVKRFEMGITNYTPKLTLGAAVEPLVYLVKHPRHPDYSQALAKALSEAITQPEDVSHDTSRRLGNEPVDFKAIRAMIARDQNPYADSDLFARCGEYTSSAMMRMTNLYGLYPEFNSAQRSSVVMEGGRRTVLLGTNSYLGAAADPRVIEASAEALRTYGTGCSGSPLMNGTLDIHKKLEDELVEFSGRQAVMVCSTGYQTNLAAIDGLCKPGDLILMDARNHRSLFDAARMSGADYAVYRHNDMEHLEKILRRNGGRRMLIVADSLFSMEGTVADLVSICELARRYGARTFIDESHAVGVLGENGRGIAEMQGVEDQVDLIMGTFSKSFASIGGFVAGDERVIDYLKHNSGPHIFSASLPPASVAAIRTVLQIIHDEPEGRAQILEKARYMADSLSAMGYRAGFKGTQIVPVAFGSFELALAAYRRFKDEGVFVNPIGPPAVPVEDAGFRTSYMSAHDWDDLEAALKVFDRHKDILVAA